MRSEYGNATFLTTMYVMAPNVTSHATAAIGSGRGAGERAARASAGLPIQAADRNATRLASAFPRGKEKSRYAALAGSHVAPSARA